MVVSPSPNNNNNNNTRNNNTTETSDQGELGTTADVDPISTEIRPAVEVVAPLDMPAGFRFRVNSGDRLLEVQVPEGGGGGGEGGVVAGQRFAAWVISEEESISTRMVPNGEPAPPGWRDGLFNCLKHGYCHPMLCLSCWCAPCALGQVMTRARLDILGNPRWSSPHETSIFWTPYKFLWALTAGYIFMRGITQTILDYKVDIDDDDDDDDPENTTDDEYPPWAEALIFFRFLVFMSFASFILILVIKTRQYLRKKYHIPAERCGVMEDCCVSFFCPCCAICHMARHTNDYDRYTARCCTDTGLGNDAPFYV